MKIWWNLSLKMKYLVELFSRFWFRQITSRGTTIFLRQDFLKSSSVWIETQFRNLTICWNVIRLSLTILRMSRRTQKLHSNVALLLWLKKFGDSKFDQVSTFTDSVDKSMMNSCYHLQLRQLRISHTVNSYVEELIVQ